MAVKYSLQNIIVRFKELREHTRKDDTVTQVSVWDLTCAVCRKPFEFFKPALDGFIGLDLGRLARRCPECIKGDCQGPDDLA